MIRENPIGVNDGTPPWYPDPVDELDGFHDSYTAALHRVGKLNTELNEATFARNEDARERLPAEIAAANAERDVLKDKIARDWLRGLRFAIDLYPNAVRHHLDEVLQGGELEQRIDAAENAIVTLESGVTT